jgi:hypothetical protein
MTDASLVRGDKVRHTSPDVIGAGRGVVLAVFTDLEHQAYAAVQWKGGALSLTRLHLLAPIGTAPKHQANLNPQS